MISFFFYFKAKTFQYFHWVYSIIHLKITETVVNNGESLFLQAWMSEKCWIRNDSDAMLTEL